MIVVVKKNGIACIGGDTLITPELRKTSLEDVSNCEKILSVGKTFLGAEGDASLPLVLGSYFRKQKKLPSFKSREDIFDELLKVHTALKDEYFLNSEQEDDDSFESIGFQMLLANQHGIFGTYFLRSVQEYSRFYAIGEGSDYAMGALEALYDRLKTAEELVQAAIKIAAEFDVNVGVPGKTFTVKIA